MEFPLHEMLNNKLLVGENYLVLAGREVLCTKTHTTENSWWGRGGTRNGRGGKLGGEGNREL